MTPIQNRATEYSMKEIVLGKDTVNTCNPAVDDIDADGLAEIAIPFNQGEQDIVRLYDHTGELAWETKEVEFYHSFYNDPSERIGGSHWHYRSRHRHLLTEIVHFGSIPSPVVVVGDGPLYILDGKTGEILQTIDLRGHIPLWTAVHLEGTESKSHLVACVNSVDREGEGFLVCVDPAGKRVWEREQPGNVFTDTIRAGDLGGHGKDSIGFSIERSKKGGPFFVMYDCDGNLLWLKKVREEIADNYHVDDFKIGRFGPDGEPVVATGTGCCLFDKDGRKLWSRADVFKHGQAVLTTRFVEHLPGNQFYFITSSEGKVGLVDYEGSVLWTFCDFSANGQLARNGTAFIQWDAPLQILQTEYVRDTRAPFYLTILNSDGTLCARIPIPHEHKAGCAIPARMSRRDRDDIVIVTEDSSRILLIENKTG